MLDLDAKVFGDLRYKDVIGETPSIEQFEDQLSSELNRLVEQADKIDSSELKRLSEHQKIIERQVNSRPGAMALSQSKIRLFIDYNKKYLQYLQNRL